METVLVKPNHETLRKHIQYFLFFNKTDHKEVRYTTFPNNNLCLAIYKENAVQYSTRSADNHCLIGEGFRSFSTRLYGFHKSAFQVAIQAPLDQVCIIFYPSSLRAFTQEPYEHLINTDFTFDKIFQYQDSFLLEQLFEESDFNQRAQLLEQFLLKNLKGQISYKLQEALYYIQQNITRNNLSIETISAQLGISDTTLFRLFKNNLGQNPKTYLKTVRFRSVLSEITHTKSSLTELAYEYQYYDQAHFINDCKSFSGYSPKKLMEKVSVQQNELLWVYNNSLF